MGPIITKIAKMLVFDVLTEPEKIVKFIFFILVLPILIFSLVFTVPISLAVSVPTILINGDSSPELIAKQLEILSYYQEVPIIIEENIDSWISEKEEEYSWCDDIDVTKDYFLSWQQLIAIDGVLLEQDFTKASKNKILDVGNKFINKSVTTKEYTETKTDEEGNEYTVTKIIAYINVSTRVFDEVLNILYFNSFSVDVANNIYNTIGNAYTNFNIIDDVGNAELASIELDASLYKMGNSDYWLTGDVDINPIFAGRLAALAESNYRNINIVSGYRSVQEQLILWNSYPPEQRGKYVAIPGRSRHQYGIAADCDGWVKSLSNKQLIPFGLYKPMAYEDWHIEPIETMKN